MGMAASQARYLALVARKSNCEYEGQQINQARTALSNQSANLFNQMLGLSVPVPPSTQDFTKTQYSFKDGVNSSTISDWQQLSAGDPDYNYVVTHYYYTDQYTGSQKMMNDPQVQFTTTPATAAQIAAQRSKVAVAETELKAAKEAEKAAKAEYESALASLNAKKTEATNLENYSTSIEGITNVTYNKDDLEYKLTPEGAFYDYSKLSGTNKTVADTLISDLVEIGALPESYNANKEGLFFSADGSSFAYGNDLTSMVANVGNGTLNTYSSSNVGSYEGQISSLETLVSMTQATYDASVTRSTNAQAAFDAATEDYNNLQHPEYVGNSELTALASLTSDQEAEIRQIVVDMQKEGITSEITKYYNPETGEYSGGLYSFKSNGITYFTTYSDLENSFTSGTGINHIDNQVKLAYYNATYVSTKVEKTEKALVETDGNGRFSSIRFEDDSVKYALTMETITDDVAYQDAMNQYYYENAKYDKMVQDINAKTSIIQHEDQQLELRLKQLDTEQKALSTEMEAVKKVVDSNVDSTFKTFNG